MQLLVPNYLLNQADEIQYKWYSNHPSHFKIPAITNIDLILPCFHKFSVIQLMFCQHNMELWIIKISLNTFLKQTLSYFQLPKSERTIPHGPGICVEGQVVQGTERREHKLFILSCRLPSEHSQQDVYKSASILILPKKFQRLKNVLHYLLLIN